MRRCASALTRCAALALHGSLILLPWASNSATASDIDELAVGTKRLGPVKARVGAVPAAGEPTADTKPNVPKEAKAPRGDPLEVPLGALLGRCQKMLDMQTTLANGTKTLAKAIEGAAGKKPRPEDMRAALKLAAHAQELIAEASSAIKKIEADGSAVAFAEVFHQVREDMKCVQRRLEAGDVGRVTRAIQQDTLETLEEMIKALKKT